MFDIFEDEGLMICNRHINSDLLKIGEVEKIEDYEELGEYSADYFELFVEKPCLAACRIFEQKNIVTISSTANKERDYVQIILRYNSLSEQNKKIADQMMIEHPTNFYFAKAYRNFDTETDRFAMTFKCSNDDLIETWSNFLVELANRFEDQDVIYGKLSIEQAFKKFCKAEIAESGLSEDESIEKIKKNSLLIFDSDEKMFWEHPNLLSKHKRYIETHAER